MPKVARRAITTIALATLVTSVPLALQASAADAVQIDRVAGADRYATSVAISAKAERSPNGVVFLASGENFPDALAGSAVAAQLNAPVLLTRPGALPRDVAGELDRLDPREIVILGGQAAVSADVEKAAASYGPVRRIEGADRYDTASALADFGFPDTRTAYIASGTNFPDALSAAPAAAHRGAPVLLTRPDSLSPGAARVVNRLRDQPLRVVGGTGAVSGAVSSELATYSKELLRLQGRNRYATSAVISQEAFNAAGTVYLANGQNFPDALAGAPLAAKSKSPVLLVTKDLVSFEVCVEIGRLGPTRVVALGGEGAISAEALRAAAYCSTGVPRVVTPGEPGDPGAPGQPGTPAPPAGPGSSVDTLDRYQAETALATIMRTIPLADNARYNLADPLADDIGVLLEAAKRLQAAGAPASPQQAYYLAQVDFIVTKLTQASVYPAQAEPPYDEARAAIGTILPILNPILNTQHTLP